MSTKARDRMGFIVTLVVCAGFLFVARAPMMRGYAALLGGAGSATGTSASSAMLAGTANLLYIVPAIALIIAARGSTWRRKVAWLTLLLGVLVGFHLTLAFAGLTRMLTTHSGGTPAGAVAATLIYHTLPIVWPIAAVVMFVGGRPPMLWDSQLGDAEPSRR